MVVTAVSGFASEASARIAASVVIDQTNGRILHSYNPDRKRAPASLAKLMTLYLVFEALEEGRISLNTRWRVSRHASRRQPSKLYLRAGTRVTVEQMILGMTVRSANDAAAVAGENLGGSVSEFARQMTARAHRLGMRNTVFRNASGLPAGGRQHTTARDMAKLAHAIYRDFPQYYHYFSRRSFRFGRRTYRATHRLMRRHRGIDGLKTGYTRRARFNLITSAEYDHQRIAVIVLGASSSAERYSYTRAIMTTIWGRIPSQPGTMVAEAIANHDPDDRRTRIQTAAAETETRDTESTAQAQDNSGDEARVQAESGESRLTLASQARASESETEVSVSADAIQVGTYRNMEGAQRAVLRARAKLPERILDDTRLVVAIRRGRTGRFYRARILGMSGDKGRQACRILMQNDIDCITIRHDAPVRRIQPAAANAEVDGEDDVSPETTPAAESASDDVATASGDYAIQTGAYQYLGDAQRGARRASARLPQAYRDASRMVILNKHRGYYRVRFLGMSHETARAACRALRERNQNCIALRHESSASRSTAGSGRYAIQVGAFRSMRSARRAARIARSKMPSAYRDSSRMIIMRRHRGYYRVRFIGFTRARAVRACRVLRSHSNDCIALRHR